MLGFQRDNIPLAGFGAAPHRPPSEAKCKGKAAQGRRASHAPYQPKTGFQRDNIPLAGFGAAPHRPPSSQQKKQRQSRPRAASKPSHMPANARIPKGRSPFGGAWGNAPTSCQKAAAKSAGKAARGRLCLYVCDLESQRWLACGLACSPPLGGIAYAFLLLLGVLVRWGVAPCPTKGTSPLWNPFFGYPYTYYAFK